MLGIVGVGQVGREVARRATARGIALVAFDPIAECVDGYRAAGDLAEVGAAADELFVAVPAAVATEVAKEVAAVLRPHAVYLDWSSCASGAKALMAETIGSERFLDVALLDSITASSPLVCIAGKQASRGRDLVRALGFEVVEVGQSPGDAARVKMLRSLFMKPFEVLAIDLLCACDDSPAAEAAVASVERSLREPFLPFALMLLRTNRLHAERRAVELADAADETGRPASALFLQAAQQRLLALERSWARPDAPPPDANVDDLLAYLREQSAIHAF